MKITALAEHNRNRTAAKLAFGSRTILTFFYQEKICFGCERGVTDIFHFVQQVGTADKLARFL
jgi:hypothetical protein